MLIGSSRHVTVHMPNSQPTKISAAIGSRILVFPSSLCFRWYRMLCSARQATPVSTVTWYVLFTAPYGRYSVSW